MNEKHIRTILGPIDPEEIGITDCHDHLVRIGGEEVRRNKDFLINDVNKAIKEMQEYYKAGGRTLIDAQPLGCGRDVLYLEQVARASGVNIVATTGVQKGEFYDVTHWYFHYSAEQMAELFMQELVEGLDTYNYLGPIVKRMKATAGVLKVGTGYQAISNLEQKGIKAVSLAHKATGCPISTHTQNGTMALEQAELFESYGVDLNKVIIGHIDRNPDFEYHKMVAKKGVFLEYDGPGRVKYWPDNFIVDLICKMIDAGFEKQILLGLDLGRASYWKTFDGGPSFTYIIDKFVPRLKLAGIPDSIIQDFLINNPKRAFAW